LFLSKDIYLIAECPFFVGCARSNTLLNDFCKRNNSHVYDFAIIYIAVFQYIIASPGSVIITLPFCSDSLQIRDHIMEIQLDMGHVCI